MLDAKGSRGNVAESGSLYGNSKGEDQNKLVYNSQGVKNELRVAVERLNNQETRLEYQIKVNEKKTEK